MCCVFVPALALVVFELRSWLVALLHGVFEFECCCVLLGGRGEIGMFFFFQSVMFGWNNAFVLASFVINRLMLLLL